MSYKKINFEKNCRKLFKQKNDMLCSSIDQFRNDCPLTIFQYPYLEREYEISEGGCRASVFQAKIGGRPCIAKLYDYEYSDWDSIDEFLEDFLEICSTLSYFKEEENESIIPSLGIVIHQTKENVQIYLLTEDKQAKDLYGFMESDVHWISERSNNRNDSIKYSSYFYNHKGITWYYMMDPSEKLKILRSMVLSVKRMHDLDYVHLDLKPYNMVITKNKDVYLIDYDSMTYLDGESEISIYIRCGTTGYCANEQWDYRASKKTDIYSLGVSMVELWAGYIWEDESCDRQISRNELLKRIRFIEKKEPKLGKIFRKCVSSKEKDRYSTDKLWREISRDDLITIN